MTAYGSRLRDEQSGFTLVELLVVMVLLTVIGGILTNSIVSALTASRRGQDRIYALTALETAAQRMAREIRSADPIESADADSITMVAYRDPGRSEYQYQAPTTTGDLIETRTVYSTPTTTVIESGPSARPLIIELDQSGVTTFSYFDAAGDPWDPATGDETDIHRVRITLAKALVEQEPIVVETSVYLRNKS